jgi:hypothetical protein
MPAHKPTTRHSDPHETSTTFFSTVIICDIPTQIGQIVRPPQKMNGSSQCDTLSTVLCCPVKGTLARDFRLLVFFIKSIHLVP